MKRVLLLAVTAGFIGCGTDTPTGEKGQNGDDPTPASVVVVHAVRGRQDTATWYITPDLENQGGAGEFYIHVEGTRTEIGGPRAQCGLTQTVTAPGGWRDTLDFVFECPRAPQFLTVYTRDADSADFRITDEYVY